MSSRQPAPRPVQSGRGLVFVGAAVVVAVVVAVLFLRSQGGTSTASDEVRNDGYGTASAPVTVEGAVVRVGVADPATTIELWEDPACPVCAALERTHGQELAQAVDEGRVAVRYRSLDFLNSSSASGDYSSRAAGALLCVAQDGDGAAYPAFHDALYANQPQERGDTDLDDAALADLARGAGASDAGVACVRDGARTAEAAAAAAAGEQELATALGTDSIGTPTVLQDGQQVNLQDPEWVANLG